MNNILLHAEEVKIKRLQISLERTLSCYLEARYHFEAVQNNNQSDIKMYLTV